ncbi:N-acetyl-gamma-glutamyl-phosphate reductase [Candidatus Poribacteria bacterium]|jgi:N-acetyl-gamma-glutamyl-phosphate reductase|nr:N-acetyl-gamma-glutamyl-phosphate reductase [Candidatus Poribacteria bacterium]MBT5536943.1 N-acetyl-gamma-glutamyl-phosphate reductase [Candidatus Poribacteria bacterium]MBT5715069.1 N-acetyl-gamma-glutamyl-phosphate reductase [Candidatus Poribacteria bacterium]MBT7097094.1 N-acetyl-gamma-glutamyl-phosphate reductase [Candidatus Poribacteria bacterium]MBT7809316.1 N-acetyl-gamma-glutamyl-phosphate reductase [Candidatus Poribacteria bacterium]
MRIGIVGAGSYPACELVRLLAGHPGGLSLEVITSRTADGRRISDVSPNLRGYCDLAFEPTGLDTLRGRVDTVVLSVPHRAAQEHVPSLLDAGFRVVDFSADFRLHDADTYENWYGTEHVARGFLGRAVYGLPERYRDDIRDADLVANPGCYPTSGILGALPLIADGLVEPDSLIIDSKTGMSGASRTPSDSAHFVSRHENITAYNIGKHRHTPEIEQELGAVTDADVTVSFTPHLMPMTRGILSTMYGTLRRPTTTDAVLERYRVRYKDEAFVQVLDAGKPAETKAVLGSNNVHIGAEVDARVGRVVVTCAIDNLGKGAAGAVVQNLNLMAGLDETSGLAFPGMMP